jgi:hypothetical protein
LEGRSSFYSIVNLVEHLQNLQNSEIEKLGFPHKTIGQGVWNLEGFIEEEVEEPEGDVAVPVATLVAVPVAMLVAVPVAVLVPLGQ